MSPLTQGLNYRSACDTLFSPPHPCLTPPLKGNPSEFLDETYAAKTRGTGYCMVKIA